MTYIKFKGKGAERNLIKAKTYILKYKNGEFWLKFLLEFKNWLKNSL